LRAIGIFRRVTNKMVVVGEDGLGFELPTEIAGDGEETAMQHFEPLRTPEVMLFLVSASSHEVGSVLVQAVRGGMWPGGVRS